MKTKKPTAYRIGKGLVEYLKKEPLCFTYPIFGNLSSAIQEKIEEHTNGKYNTKNASYVSVTTNIPLYIMTSQALCQGTSLGEISLDQKSNLTSIALMYGSTETVIRLLGTLMKEKAIPSLFGKIFSIPLEGWEGIYDGVKNRRN